jgi:hypothetical protein
LLVVFEFKNDGSPLDAVQIASYGHWLGIFQGLVDVPLLQAGRRAGDEYASAVQNACADIVLDAPWSAVVNGLKAVGQRERAGSTGSWLCDQALEYLESTIRPPYEGPKTILDWLRKKDTHEMRTYLRILLRKMGEALEKSAVGAGAITFAKDKSGLPDILTGTISAAYVRICQDGKLVERELLGKTARLNLWFDVRYGEERLAGMDFWVEAEGAQQAAKFLGSAPDDPKAIESWNKASERHSGKFAPQFEERFKEWCSLSPSALVGVYSLGFKGNNQIWKGGGHLAGDASHPERVTAGEALKFLTDNRKAVWCFPRVGPGEQYKTIAEARPLVRKPAVALWVKLDVGSLEQCGADANKLQRLLQDAVKNLPLFGAV